MPTSCKDRFFNFNKIDGTKSIFRIEKIDFMRPYLIDYRKITYWYLTLENLDVGICSNHLVWWNNMLINNTVLIEEHTEQDFCGRLCLITLLWWWWRWSLPLSTSTFLLLDHDEKPRSHQRSWYHWGTSNLHTIFISKRGTYWWYHARRVYSPKWQN